MPAYDYHCNQCDHVFEIRRSMSAPIKVESCPQCSSTDTARIYQAPRVAGGSSHQESGGCSGGCSSCGSSSCGSCHH